MNEAHVASVRQSEGRAGARDASVIPVVLVTPMTMSDFNDAEGTIKAHRTPAPPLGLLCLAASLEQHGYQPHLVNLDGLFVEFLRTQRRHDATADFFPYVGEIFKTLPHGIYGFGSICSSYPLTLRLAEMVRVVHPDVPIILGGPQASVVDEVTMDAFPFVDFILRGEADETLPLLVETLTTQTTRTLEGVPGLTYRDAAGRLVRSEIAPIIEDLDALPLPAFHLDPDIKNRGVLHLELGRGCPFACTFCATNDFFRRNFRLKSPARMLEQMRHLKEAYGLTNFSLVHDMFTVNRRKVVEFCEALLNFPDRFTWSCSARTDCTDDELIALMARAGCNGIFFGIETGSERLQREVKKELDLKGARERIKCASEHHIHTAVALITAFPDESHSDLRDTVHFFVDSTRFSYAEPQLSLLSPLAKTPIHVQHRQELILDHIYSDIAYQGWRQDQTEVEMVRAHPDVFSSYYAVPTRELPRAYFQDVRNFVVGLTTWFRWLPVALLQDSQDLLGVFDRWVGWRQKLGVSGGSINGTPYHCHRKFPEEFLEFVRDAYVPVAAAPVAIQTVIATESVSLRTMDEAGGTQGEPEWGSTWRSGAEESGGVLDPEARPQRAKYLLIRQLGLDYKELLRCLREDGDLTRVRRRNVAIGIHQLHCERVVVRLLTPLSLRLIDLCNGSHTVNGIVSELAGEQLDGIPDAVDAALVCDLGLKSLLRQGLIELSAA